MGQANIQETSSEPSLVAESQERILMDLVNALLAEGVFHEDNRGELLDLSDTRNSSFHWWTFLEAKKHSGPYFRWWMNRDTGRFVIFPVRSAVVQAYRYYAGGGVYVVDEMKLYIGLGPARLDAIKLLELVAEELYYDYDHADVNNPVTRVKQLLQLSLEQSNWSDAYAAASDRTASSPWDLIGLEQQASWRDRPFHPLAKAKGRWTQADYEAYSAESGQPISLEWLAVRKEFVLTGKGNTAAETPVDMLLLPEERLTVQHAMKRKGLSPDRYIALPVHPWQRSVMLPQMLQAELASDLCIPLDVTVGVYYASSSARSLAPQSESNRHLKLPLGIVSLGAVRYLPAVHMINGERGQLLLEQAQRCDSLLEASLSLCDERSWWAYMPADGDYFAEAPRHLSALVRQYPASCLEADTIRLVPMSALAAYAKDGGDTLFALWIKERNLPDSSQSAAHLFGEVCLKFLTVGLRLFQLGVMPEIHGQNVLLIMKDYEITGLLLRDHDSVRLHVPWMTRNGLDDPNYMMKPGYPNSLYNETPQKLLVYLQTLGIQVNLYAILEAIAAQYEVEERQLWLILLERLRQAIDLAELTEDVKAVVEASLLEQPSWPWKNLLRPLLEQSSPLSGSMPASMGETVNPFHRI
jgi:siderophore synthetase component